MASRAELAELALRRVAGFELRCLGRTCAEAGDVAFLEARADVLDGAAGQAAAYGDGGPLEALLDRAAAGLLEALPPGLGQDARGCLRAAAEALGLLSRELREGGEGFAWLGGSKVGTGGSDRVVGILPMAAAVFRHVSLQYDDAAGSGLASRRDVRLAVGTMPAHGSKPGLPPVHGTTNLAKEGEAAVRVLFERGERWPADTPWHVAYTLYHELACHAYQGALLEPPSRGNASEECAWTEGWMDAVAFALAGDALAGKAPPGIGMPTGGAAQDAVRGLHAARYRPPVADASTLHLRVAARDAFGGLVEALLLSGAEAGEEQAAATAVRFSLLLNTNVVADGTVLEEDLWPWLSGAFAPLWTSSGASAEARTYRSFEAARACRSFMEDRSLPWLCERLRSALGTV